MRTRILSPTLLLLATAIVATAAESGTTPPPAPAPAATDIADRVTVTGDRATARPETVSATATRTSTPLEELPQSVQVIPGKVLAAQQVQTVTEALTNISGVQSQPLLNRNLDPMNERLVRGFQAETYRNGFPLHYNAGDRESLANVERVEVLKGPTALLFANGVGAPTGGLINLVQKQPGATPSYGAKVTAGSYNQYAGAIDLNQPIVSGDAGSVQSRLTAEIGHRESHVDVIEGDYGSIDPTIALRNNHGTTLTIHGRWSQVLQHDYSGLPIQGTIVAAPFTVDRDLFPANEDLPRTRSQVASIDAILEQKLSEHVTFTLPVQFAKSELYQYGQYLVTVAPPIYAMDSVFVSQELEEFSITPTLAWSIPADGIRTTVLVGGDYDHTTERGMMIGGSTFPPFDVTNPVAPPFVLDPALATYIDADNVYRTAGGFVQVQSTIADRVTVVGGLRYTYAQINDRDLVSGDQSYSESRLLPRVGAIVAITSWLSAFADYGEGFRAIPYAQSVLDPKPEESDQYEVGLKLIEEKLVTATVAAFQLTRTNVAVADPLTAPLRVQTGEQRSRGLEFDVLLTPDDHWTLLANYALTDAEVTKDNTYEGNTLYGVPRHAGRVWLGYEFRGLLPGFGLGAGVTALSKQQVDIANTAETPGYATVDAGAHYQWTNYTVSLGAKNLFGKDYYEPNSYFGPCVTPGDPLTFVGSLAATF